MQPSLRQRSWEWILKQPDFQSNELAAVLGIDKKQTRSVMSDLVKKQCIVAIKTASKPYVYKKVTGANPNFSRDRPNPHSETNSRQKIWQAMRFLKQFTVGDIEAATQMTAHNIRVYISALTQYGYVSRIQKNYTMLQGKRVHHPCKYALLKNTGRAYPTIRNVGLFDQNTKTVIPKLKQRETS